jgi:quinoprotein glucose dehydrogenase
MARSRAREQGASRPRSRRARCRAGSHQAEAKGRSLLRRAGESERQAGALGGNAIQQRCRKGRNIFLNNNAVYCQRCHKLDNQGGDVGPSLNGIASQPGKDRRYLLESVVFPNAQIAKGYETVVLTLTDGRVVSGVLKADDKKTLRLMTAEAMELVISVEDIDSRRTGPSAMPDDLHKKLSRRELRDLVEFLAELKEPAKK